MVLCMFCVTMITVAIGCVLIMKNVKLWSLKARSLVGCVMRVMILVVV